MANEVTLCSGSLGRWPVYGYENNIGSSPFWPASNFENYGAKGIFEWADNIGNTGIPPWNAIVDGMVTYTGTTKVWFVPLWRTAYDDIHGCFNPTERDAVAAVCTELRAQITGVEIIASASPTYSPLHVYPGWTKARYQKSASAVSWALANGYADRAGPVLTPITFNTNNGPSDPAHQGVGQTSAEYNNSDHPAILAAYSWLP